MSNMLNNKLKVFVAMDSFKGSITSLEAGNAVKNGILKANKEAEVSVCPIADGGEGTLQVLISNAMKNSVNNATIEEQSIFVTGPLGNKIHTTYFIQLDEEHKPVKAFMEMAKAAGLPLVPEDKRNPKVTTTYGVGEMIRDAIEKGCRDFIIGIGGSATNDAGVGMLQALGFRFYDKNGRDVSYGMDGVSKICDIGFEDVMYELSDCHFTIACDVTNPLVGEQGASFVFAPQKGAQIEELSWYDSCMNHYADIVEHIAMCQENFLYHGIMKQGIPKMPLRFLEGVGAAGGLGYAFRVFLQGELKSGIQIVMDELGYEDYIKNADVVVTGEGCLDEQSVMGKVVFGIGTLAKKYDKKVYAFAGSLGEGAEACIDTGLVDNYFSIQQKPVSLEKALQSDYAEQCLSDTVYRVFRIVNVQ